MGAKWSKMTGPGAKDGQPGHVSTPSPGLNGNGRFIPSPESSPVSSPLSGRGVDPAEVLGSYCPVCGERLSHEKCKVVCRSSRCVHRIVFNCSEF